jgi:hypothetical protein
VQVKPNSSGCSIQLHLDSCTSPAITAPSHAATLSADSLAMRESRAAWSCSRDSWGWLDTGISRAWRGATRSSTRPCWWGARARSLPAQTLGGKLFAGFYALYSGLVFLVAIALVLAPIVHRILHTFHWDRE